MNNLVKVGNGYWIKSQLITSVRVEHKTDIGGELYLAVIVTADPAPWGGDRGLETQCATKKEAKALLFKIIGAVNE